VFRQLPVLPDLSHYIRDLFISEGDWRVVRAPVEVLTKEHVHLIHQQYWGEIIVERDLLIFLTDKKI
jgi:hypothetical protein